MDTIGKIAFFMREGDQEAPEHWNGKPLNKGEGRRFLGRVDEELDETYTALRQENPAETLDGFIDIAYAALTGAIRTGGEKAAREAWDAVVDANQAKIDGRYGPKVVNELTGKILKPEGWESPDIEGILQRNLEAGKE